jgi:outer membrane protein OmpA-like peptidoglycan-associated protein
VDRPRIVRTAAISLVVALVAGMGLSGCAGRRAAPAGGPREESSLEQRLAQLDHRLGQLEGELRGQRERLDRLEARAGEMGSGTEDAGRRARAAASAAAEAADRADRAGSVAAEAKASAERAAEAADQALGRLEAVEKRLGRTVAARPSETVVETAVVQFAFDRWELDGRAQAVLGEVLKRLEQDPALLVTLEGFADSVGRDGYNFELSRKRAEAVRRFIVDRGVGLRRIEHIGFGETHPVADNATAEGRAKNRRVVIKIAAGE